MKILGLFLFLPSLVLATTAGTIDDFGPSSQARFGWEIVNDGVMGGLSKGSLAFTDSGTLVFSGTLSLANGGGFSSVRSSEVPHDLSKATGISLRVRGDGRTYMLRLTTDAQARNRRIAFMAPFPTAPGGWSEVRIPFSLFKGTLRGEPVPSATLHPARIETFGFQIADGKEGPFELEVDWMRPFAK